MSLISQNQYEKMDEFVNELNESINVVGDYSLYLFNRFRNYIGHLFVAVTTIAMTFITAEFVREFEITFFGIELYFIVLIGVIIPAAYLAIFGEDAKIALVKGAVFSSDSNRLWQALAALAVIGVLMMINAKGTQKIADYSLRYMNKELQDSYLIKLKEQKMQAHVDTAKITTNKIGDTAVKMLMLSRNSLVEAKKREINAIQNANDNWIKGRDPKAYRTIIARKRVETAKLIAKIEDRYAQKLAKMDWKIQKAEEKVNSRIQEANRLKIKEMEKADNASRELETFYKSESLKNKNFIDRYKNIGLWIAISGEAIDGLLAFLLFMLAKSNPNLNGTPRVQKNTRKIVKLTEYDTSESIKVDRLGDTHKGGLKFYLKSQKDSLPKNLEDNEQFRKSMFEQIKKVSEYLANQKPEHIKLDGVTYLRHPRQRKIIKFFKDNGIIITPRDTKEYLHNMNDNLKFVNQKVGFVYITKTKNDIEKPLSIS